MMAKYTKIADQVVPQYRDARRNYICGGAIAARWQAAWDAACIAHGDSPDHYREEMERSR